jgi:hypothetical protein
MVKLFLQECGWHVAGWGTPIHLIRLGLCKALIDGFCFCCDAGTQWPSWNKTLNLQSQHGLPSMDRASTRKLLEQGVPVTDESNSQRSFEATHVHQFENSNTSRMLASRALEELARTPSQSATVAATVPAAAAVAKQPPSVAVTASSAANQQRAFASNTSGKRTAQLTIFYAGAVNVFDDVTQEKDATCHPKKQSLVSTPNLKVIVLSSHASLRNQF